MNAFFRFESRRDRPESRGSALLGALNECHFSREGCLHLTVVGVTPPVGALKAPAVATTAWAAPRAMIDPCFRVSALISQALFGSRPFGRLRLLFRDCLRSDGAFALSFRYPIPLPRRGNTGGSHVSQQLYWGRECGSSDVVFTAAERGVSPIEGQSRARSGGIPEAHDTAPVLAGDCSNVCRGGARPFHADCTRAVPGEHGLWART